jgi:hypothetical protein
MSLFMEEYLALRHALKAIRKEAKKAKPDPDKIYLIADEALDLAFRPALSTPAAQEDT